MSLEGSPGNSGTPGGVEGFILSKMTFLIANYDINNRGASYEDFPETGWDKVMELNVKSIFYCELNSISRLSIVIYHLLT